MSIYQRPVRSLILDMIEALCPSTRSIFTRQQAVAWFSEHYGRIKEATVTCHLIRFSTNAPLRFQYNARPGEEDRLFKIDGSHYRRYDPANDPAPLTKPGQAIRIKETEISDEDSDPSGKRFAGEHDLRDYLAKNLHRIEPGLHFDTDEDRVTGTEFPAGSRFIDILALDKANNFVVVELKVSRGYDRTVGQLLRYVAWIERNHASPGQMVRGIIIARDISEDLRLACSKTTGGSLFEYEMSFTLKPVDDQPRR